MSSNYKALITKIKQAGLLGRGCGTFPTGKKWEMVFSEPEKEKYVICNASESEPGIFKDRFLLDNYPEKIIEGISLAMKTLKASKGFIYLKPLYYNQFRQKLEVLIGNDNIELFGKPAPDYIGGEESAMINIMEGKREEPRYKPPFVTKNGLFGKPTLVNNCETFYDIALIDRGEYDHQRFFCVSGHNTPDNVFRFPENISVKQALLDSGHYPDFPFFIQLGGAMAGTCLAENQLEDFAIQHYSGLVIRPLDLDEKKLVLSWLEFFRDQSCGQCVPCREGTYRLYEMYKSGQYDKKLMADIIYTMNESSLCSLGKMATTAFVSYYKNIKNKPVSGFKTGDKKCVS